MFTRRSILGALASMGAFAASGAALAKKKRHQNGRALLGDKVKKNGKHNLHKAGKVDVSVDVSNGKVVALAATDPAKGNLRVGKVKSRKKLAAAASGLILAAGPGTQYAQYADYYYGYWFDDGIDDWYYWFTVDVIIVDGTWVEYVG